MSDKEETLYKELIKDYTHSIESLQAELSKKKDVECVCRLRRQIEAYKRQLSTLEYTIK